MKYRYEHLNLAISAVAILSLAAGLLVARFSGSLIACGATTFVAIVGLASLLRGFFVTWSRERYAENSGYEVVVTRYYERLRPASSLMLVTAGFLGWYAFAANETLAAVGAGMAAGLPILGFAMKSAFEVKAIKP